MQGTCERCQTQIPQRDRYCKPCRSLVRAEEERIKARREANIKSWRNLAGELVEGPITQVCLSKRVVFENEMRGRVALDSCGSVLDHLIGVCFAEPEYLREGDAARYIALLSDFREFVFTSWRTREKELAVKNAPLALIGEALEDWINMFFRNDHHPLMPAYALDTAEFMFAHVAGAFRSEPEFWELKAIVPDDGYKLFDVLHDARFKKDFTKRFGGTLVRCRVPMGSCVKYGSKEMLPQGGEFCANIKRCHLSTNFYDAVLLNCEAPKNTTVHLDLGFFFVAEVLLRAEGSLYKWEQDPELHPIRPAVLEENAYDPDCNMRQDTELPPSWIVSAFDYNKREWRVVPEWYAELSRGVGSA